MNLPILSTAAQTMSSREIAELTGKRHDNVVRDIRQMLESLDASILSHEEYQEVKDDRGYTTEFRLNKSLTLTLITGYDVNRRHKINVRWMELERMAHASPDLTTDEGKLLMIQDLVTKQLVLLSDNKRISAERDEAIRTKAQIGSRREATAMATAAKATREAAKMAELVGRAVNHACVLAVQAATGAKYAWHPLKAYCLTNGLPILRVHSEAYGEVNSYPASAWLEVYGVDLGQLWGVAA